MDNSIKRQNHENMLQEWSWHIQECRKNGGNIKKYCKEHGLTKSSYYYWQRKLFERVSNEVQLTPINSKTEFAEISLDSVKHEETAVYATDSADAAVSINFNGINFTIHNSASPLIIESIIKGLTKC